MSIEHTMIGKKACYVLSESSTQDDVEKIVEKTNDAVNHPSHYTSQGGIEVIDLIEMIVPAPPFHIANAIKYIARRSFKNSYEEDTKKAIWYLRRYLEVFMGGSYIEPGFDLNPGVFDIAKCLAEWKKISSEDSIVLFLLTQKFYKQAMHILIEGGEGA